MAPIANPDVKVSASIFIYTCRVFERKETDIFFKKKKRKERRSRQPLKICYVAKDDVADKLVGYV